MKNKLITDDIKKLIKSAISGEYTISKYNLSNHEKFRIGGIDVVLSEKQNPIVYISSDCDNEYIKLWNNDVGKVLTKELKKPDPEIYELKTKTFKAILKLISNEELESFKEKGFVHVSIDDNNYTIIKAVKPNRYYFDRTGDYDIELKNDTPKHIEIIEIDDDFEEDPLNDSYALF